ncbi:MAG: VWA domain-containing protein [Bacteroidota bacterium]|nr:VWA domain-containing protein [Bacteroidota bacterium]
MNNITFASAYFFYLLFLIPLFIYWYWKRNRQQYVEMQVSTLESFQTAPRSWRQRFRHILFAFRIFAFILLVIALARPQSSTRSENVTTEGIDIVLSTDISGSMLAEDLRPNRIDAAKQVALDFIDNRENDRIGLVIFAGESFTQCPLTTDRAVVKNLLKDVKSGMIEDGTAIGMGIATSVSRLKESKAKSKIIILLTDGINNRGFIDPLTAAEIAQRFEIRIYSIGVGTIGLAPYPVQTPFGTQYQNVPVQIDEELMKKISEMTGGKYFRATDNKKLKAIYQEIDKLEKTKIEVTEFRRKSEQFTMAALFAGLFLLLEILFRYTIFRINP